MKTYKIQIDEIPSDFLGTLISPTEIRRITGLSGRAITHLRRSGKIPFYKMPNGRYKYPPYIVNILPKIGKEIEVYDNPGHIEEMLSR